MKVIPTKDLKVLVSHPIYMDGEKIQYWDKDTFEALLETYGDDWFSKDGKFQCCKENQQRKEFIEQYKRKK